MDTLLKKFSTTRLIAMSFLLVILIGTLLLSLPIAAKDGAWTPLLDALFTATSATCVTGLIVYDTFTHWSLFGQLVILCMIQIGGLGLMTIIVMIFIFLKKKISLRERTLLMQSAGTMRMNGVVRLIRHIVRGTFFIEGIGALLLAFYFVPQFGLGVGIYNAIFHSISAFCNAGFDLMGRVEAFSSLTTLESNWYVNLIIMTLVILGGLGFLVWDEIMANGIHFKRYSLHAKIVLLTSVLLLFIGHVGFFILEYDNNLAGYSLGDKILSAGFMSMTTRTAGFNTMDLGNLTESSSLLAMFLMLVGGSPGSTAGGIKTTTIAVIFLAIRSMARGESEITVFKKRISSDMVKQAAVIILIYLTAIMLGTLVICQLEPAYTLTDILFETFSAVATVGISRGITPSLGALSHIILIIMMFGGRIGGLSLVLVFGEKKKTAYTKRPSENIMIG